MWTYIYNEVLSWVVDGVNTSFTTINNIEKIEEVYIWGVSYRDVSFVWNVVTFLLAPPLWAGSPTIDYFQEDLTVPTVSAGVTLGDIIEETFDSIWVERTSNVHLERAAKRHIIKGIEKIRNQRFYRDVVLSYSFNKAKDGEAQSYNASFVDIKDRDYVPSSGFYMLKDWVVIEYTNFTDWKLMWAAWVVYKIGDDVSIGYKIPDGIKKPSEVIMKGIALEYRDIREFVINRKFYTIKKMANGDSYLFLPFTNDDELVTVRYIPEYTIASADATLINIEYEYTPVISEYAAYKMLLDREDDRWQAKKVEYKESLKEYKAYKARAVDDTNWQFQSNILTGF